MFTNRKNDTHEPSQEEKILHGFNEGWLKTCAQYCTFLFLHLGPDHHHAVILLQTTV